MAFAIVLLRRFSQLFCGLGVCARLFAALYRRVFDANAWQFVGRILLWLVLANAILALSLLLLMPTTYRRSAIFRHASSTQKSATNMPHAPAF
jgi:hypothetical protein